MTVEEARDDYAFVCWLALAFWTDERASLAVDAASIVLDLAVAEASIERIRRSVAW